MPELKHTTVPVPDPTKLTTDAVSAAKIEIEKLFDEKLKGHRLLIDEKFSGVSKEFSMRDIALTAAFKAAEAQVTQQNTSNTLAIDKSGEGFTKQIDSLDEKIDDLKERLGLVEGRGTGRQESWTYLVAGVAMIWGGISTIILVMKLLGH